MMNSTAQRRAKETGVTHGRLPVEGEELSFEVEPDGKGKKRAIRVGRAGAAQAGSAASARPRPVRLSRAPKKSSISGVVVGLALMGALGLYAFKDIAAQLARFRTSAPVVETATSAALLPGSRLDASSAFQCDGRKYCSQMTSCKEATFFLQNCPGVQMDGNHDGVPCEQQWCR